MTFLYHADAERGAEWAALFAERAPEIGFDFRPETVDPKTVRYLGVWHPVAGMTERYPNLEVLFSLGAGVDQFDLGGLPDGLPLVRMIEPGIAGAMAEYVTFAVLGLHRDMIAYRQQQSTGGWKPLRFKPASDVGVGILGTGVLAQAALAALKPFGFRLSAWSRSRLSMAGIECFAGEAELKDFLPRCDILVCLLPLTERTSEILSARLMAQLPQGASIVNCGRGGHLIQDDLLAALDTGRLSGAVLDVADPEPLPMRHPLRTHPLILVTPHIASMTQPETAVDVVIDNIRRHRAGEQMIGVVDRTSGY